MEKIIEKLANKIVHWSCSNQSELGSEQEEILVYGYVLLLENAYKLLVLLIVALLTHTLTETIIIVGSLVLLRNFCGGVHCHGSIGCTLSMIGVWLAGLFVSKIDIPVPVIFVMAGIIIWTIVRYAPQTTRNNPIQNISVLKRKRIGAILVMFFLFGAAYVSGILWGRTDIMNMILTAMLIEVISMLILVEKEEKSDEED
ncbi:MAG: accessory gene regulator B family protein [Lachnospiraceae bacterium]|nr:accessory gene regulator B family protein [Lachnospiraceae bacterium]